MTDRTCPSATRSTSGPRRTSCSPASALEGGRRPRAAAASTSAWHPAWARRTGCSRRATGGARAARTWSSASWRPTAGRAPRRLIDGLEVVPRRRSSTGASSSRRWTRTRSSRRRPDRGAHRRAGPHQRARAPAREALAGRGADPRRGHPRHQHLQRPAPRVGRGRRRRPSPARRSTSVSRTRCWTTPTRSSSST